MSMDRSIDLPETQEWVYALKERESWSKPGEPGVGCLSIFGRSSQTRQLESVKPDTGPDALGAQAIIS